MAQSSLKKALSNHPRDYKHFKYVYPVISRRSEGVSLGINLNRNKKCNFRCVYCQVDRGSPQKGGRVYKDLVLDELRYFLKQFDSKGVCTLDIFNSVHPNDKKLKDVALSGDGEPTLYSGFETLCRKLAEFKADSKVPFKFVLITNGSRLGLKGVQNGINALFSYSDEVWVKLDAGTGLYFNEINRSSISLDQLESNIIKAGKLFPLKIQTLFCVLKGKKPSIKEIDSYIDRLTRIKEAGAKILGVQLYSLARKTHYAGCTKVSRPFLSKIAEKIQNKLSLPVWIY